AFSGFDLKKVHVAGKTGTAEVYGKADTSWFASFAPADKPRFAVVAMISQGGTGASAAAPAVREIYEAIYGLKKGAKPALENGELPKELPKPPMGSGGVIGAGSDGGPSAAPSASPKASLDAAPDGSSEASPGGAPNTVLTDGPELPASTAPRNEATSASPRTAR
ncbi:MAG: penicillin-binding protein 2, partial [Actinomadura rubrobrunea]|nr:penicillin-binding protein 2 [Actinomadura rubrobrunea]